MVVSVETNNAANEDPAMSVEGVRRPPKKPRAAPVKAEFEDMGDVTRVLVIPRDCVICGQRGQKQRHKKRSSGDYLDNEG